MSAIRDILHREEHNRSQICLYRRGIFYQAFDYSAYLFYHLVRPFKVTCRSLAKSKRSYYMLGFPSEQLSSYLVTAEYETLPDDEDARIYSPTETVLTSLPESYEQWCSRFSTTSGADKLPKVQEAPATYSVTPVASLSKSIARPDNISNPQDGSVQESRQESLPTTACAISYDLTSDDKVSLCDWLVYRILMLPTHHLCPLEALAQLDKLQDDLRLRLWRR